MKNRFSIVMIALLFFVAGCAPSNRYSWTSAPELPPKPVLIELGDAEIERLPEKELCIHGLQNDDPRLDAAIKSRGISCDPISVECLGEGLKRPSKKFDACVERRTAVQALEMKKLSNPAFGYCLDSGFKEGSDAMATCMSGYLSRQQQVHAIQQQQQQFERARKDQAWRDLGNHLRQDAITRQLDEPTLTTCSSFGSTTNCTTR